MDQHTISDYLRNKKWEFRLYTCNALIGMLHFNEYVAREDKKTELFYKRLDYIAIAACFKDNMRRDSRYKEERF